MRVSQSKNMLRQINQKWKLREPRNLKSSDYMRFIVEREIARVDRNQHEFSLLVFEVRDSEADCDQTVRLSQILQDRLRFVDEAGWLDEHKIGVILPDTPKKGAEKLARDLLQKLPDVRPISDCTVYSYPSSWIGGKRDFAERRGRDDSEHGEGQPKGETTPDRSDSKEVKEPIEKARMPVWKRLLDIVGALIGLIISAPLFMMIMVLIKVVSKGPIFIRQERIGHRGQSFDLLKFRTMKVDACRNVHELHVKDLMKEDKPLKKLDVDDDSRILPFAKVLRKCGLDELPQLFNVLRGDMSLVGPRPCLPYEAQEYLLWHTRRFDAMPGITGLWQVSGKNRTTFKQMMALDIRYLRRMSFWSDVKILFRTLPAITYDVVHHFTNRNDEG